MMVLDSRSSRSPSAHTPINVDPQAIASVDVKDGTTIVTYTDGETDRVWDTPEEIARLREEENLS